MVEALAIDPARPLIVCDADEVLLQFIVGLERFLERGGYYFDLASFRIHGNIRHHTTHEPASNEAVDRLLALFFESETGDLDPVPGAAEALSRLNQEAQIVILSNLPETARRARIDNLARHGIRYPVIAGTGPKGHTVKRLIGGHAPPVVFIDDLPPHIASVAAETPHVHRLHFIADRRLARLLPKAAEAHQRIDDWPAAADWISAVFARG